MQKSAVAEHALVEDHQIDWEDAKVLDTAQAWDRRKYKEALHIRQQGKEHPMMNKDAGWKIRGVWNEFFFMCMNGFFFPGATARNSAE